MEIPEIKQKLSIHTVLQHYHLEQDKHGRVCCPFHDDKTPSMQIYPSTNTFHCFGCDRTGDTIEFIQQKQGISKHEAILKAQELIGIHVIPNTNPQPKVVNKEKSQTPEERVSILTKIFKSFKNGLQSPISKKPKEYMESRNLWPLSGVEVEIGYNSGQFHHHDKLNETDKQACINTGLLIPYSGKIPNTSSTTYTTFAKDCIIFPLKDKTGNIVSLYGRSIINNSNAKHYYLKDRQGLYPGYPNPNTTKIILTEAIIDAATLSVVASAKAELLQYTILACYGTNGLTEEHKTAIKQLHKLDEVIFFFDGDKPGREGIKKYQEELIKLLPNVLLSAVDTPENEDVNSLLQGHEPEILNHLLENRKTLFLSTETVLTEPKPQSKPSINAIKVRYKES